MVIGLKTYFDFSFDLLWPIGYSVACRLIHTFVNFPVFLL